MILDAKKDNAVNDRVKQKQPKFAYHWKRDFTQIPLCSNIWIKNLSVSLICLERKGGNTEQAGCWEFLRYAFVLAGSVEIGHAIRLNGWRVGNWSSRQQEGINVGSANGNEIISGKVDKPGHLGVIITP